MKKALVIGINKYKRPVLGCVEDARAVAELLRKNEDGSANMQVDLQPDIPDRPTLLKKITVLFRESRLLSLLYFSGHGHVNQRGGFLITPDSEVFDEGVSMDEIVRLANTSPALMKVVILDCCNSGAIGEGAPVAGMNTQIMDGVTILTSSRASEPSLATAKGSLFTNLLLQALAGGAADIRGYVTPGSIYAYIDQALGEIGQRPVFKTNITRFIALRETIPQLPPDVLRKISDYFPDDETRYQLDPSCEDTNSPEYKPLLTAPYADPERIKIFKDLQKMQGVGLVVPIGTPHMYFAAMERKPCQLTPLGRHYRRLIEQGVI